MEVHCRAVASDPAGPVLAGPLFVAGLVPRSRTLVPSMIVGALQRSLILEKVRLAKVVH